MPPTFVLCPLIYSEIKEVRRKKERAKELEGIDLSNIVSSSRRRSVTSFAPPPKPKIPVETNGKDPEDNDDDNDDEDNDNEEDEEDEEEDGSDADGSQSDEFNEGNLRYDAALCFLFVCGFVWK